MFHNLFKRYMKDLDKDKVDILIIDDEQDICRLLQRNLSKQGLRVQFVHSLKDGLTFIQKQVPRILFLDIQLPDGSGLEFLPKVKKLFPSVKVVTISAFDTKQDQEKYLTAGAAHFLPKPFKVGELTALVQTL
jgi:DNA-binding response OmpR family regulator